jgi:gas vesicle protein
MKFTFGLLAGIAAGAAIAHYVHSREGRVLIDKIKDDIDGIGDKFSQLAEDLVEKGRSLIGTDKRQEDQLVEETIVLVVPGPEPQPVAP